MKQCIAWLLCILLVTAGALSVSAETTTAAPTTQEVVETEIVTYYEIVQKDPTPYPQGAALGMLILGGSLVLVAVALLCIFLFAFPRWGLVKNKPVKNGKAESDELCAPEEPLVAETEEVTPSDEDKEPADAESADDAEPAKAEEETAVKLEELF